MPPIDNAVAGWRAGMTTGNALFFPFPGMAIRPVEVTVGDLRYSAAG
jgi:hypothetical protein